MGHFYFHDYRRLLGAGCCPDGMEVLQPKPDPSAVLVRQRAPVDLKDLAEDEEFCMVRWRVVKKPIDMERLLAKVRWQRDQLLASSDWVELRALREARALEPEWAVYRQALRDITAQPLESIMWPAAPQQ